MKKTLLPALLLCVAMISTKVFATIHDINVSNFSFSNNTFSMPLGDTVIWHWVSGNHTTTSLSVPSGAAAWDAPMDNSNTTFMYIPTVAGLYTYDCAFHPGSMQGNFTVTSCNLPAAPGIVGQNEVCAGTPDTLAASTVDIGVSYQWQIDGITLNGATGSSYVANQTGNYTLIVTNSCGSDTSGSHSVTVDSLAIPVISFTNNGLTYTFSTDPINGGSYMWDFGDGSAVNTQQNPTYTYTDSTGDSVVVNLMVMNGIGCMQMGFHTIHLPLITTAVANYNSLGAITVSPNPASNSLQVKTNGQAVEVSIYDYTGKLISKMAPAAKSGNSQYYNVSNIPSGMYLLQLRNGSNATMQKLMIAH